MDRSSNRLFYNVYDTNTKGLTRRVTMINYMIIWLLVVIGLFVSADFINTWEVANNYPYGKLCDLYNNC